MTRSTTARTRWRLGGAAATVVALVGLALVADASTGYAATSSFPTATSTRTVNATMKVSGTFDGGLARFVAGSALGDGGQGEGQKPVFELADGATLRNVILGAPAADGVHCLGSCTLSGVWWEDVGEDAATFLGTSSSVRMTVSGGGARKADDKVFQHNGAGTLTISDFQVDNFGKLYRSCGNCRTQFARHVVVRNVMAFGPANAIVGVNSNLGDTASLSAITIFNDPSKKIAICDRFQGNNTGAEPTKVGTGPDGTTCNYSTSSITYK